MSIPVHEIVLLIIHIMILVFVIIRTVGMLKNTEKTMTAVYFLAAAASCLASDLYWLAYMLLRPETRMPFAVNEIGEAALFLLLASSLDTVFRGSPGKMEENAGKKHAGACDPQQTCETKTMVLLTVFTVFFAAANTALWIGWSGEWIQDILIGITFGYFLCKVVRSLALSGALSGTKWKLSGILSILLIAMQAATFHVPEAVRGRLDFLCYILMSGIVVLILAGNIMLIRTSCSPRILVSCAFAGFAVITIVMYMSSGRWYSMFLCGHMIILLLMCEAVKKETM